MAKAKRKPKKRPECRGTSTTHQDYELVYAYILGHGEAKEAVPGGAVYFEVSLPLEAMAREVFAGHPASRQRMRAVVDHMNHSRKPDGDYCCEIIPLKGRSQGRERYFCARPDHEDVHLVFQEEDAFRHFQGLAQGHQRRSTESFNDRPKVLAMKTHAFNSGDFEGYRLAANAIEEIDHDGDVRPGTMMALVSHFGGNPGGQTPRRRR